MEVESIICNQASVRNCDGPMENVWYGRRYILEHKEEKNLGKIFWRNFGGWTKKYILYLEGKCKNILYYEDKPNYIAVEPKQINNKLLIGSFDTMAGYNTHIASCQWVCSLRWQWVILHMMIWASGHFRLVDVHFTSCEKWAWEFSLAFLPWQEIMHFLLFSAHCIFLCNHIG